MTRTARAEMNLLKSLNAERMSHSLVDPVEEIKVPPKEFLQAARAEHEHLTSEKKKNEDAFTVGALNHLPLDSEMRQKKFPSLADRQKKRRTNHDRNIKDFEASRSLPTRLCAPPLPVGRRRRRLPHRRGWEG